MTLQTGIISWIQIHKFLEYDTELPDKKFIGTISWSLLRKTDLTRANISIVVRKKQKYIRSKCLYPTLLIVLILLDNTRNYPFISLMHQQLVWNQVSLLDVGRTAILMMSNFRKIGNRTVLLRIIIGSYKNYFFKDTAVNFFLSLNV